MGVEFDDWDEIQEKIKRERAQGGVEARSDDGDDDEDDE